MNRTPFAAPALSTLAVLAALAPAPAQAEARAAACLPLADAARLACYDRVHGRAEAALTPPPAAAPAVAATAGSARKLSHLEQRWDLQGQRSELFMPRPHKPVYLMPATWTDHLNLRPTSPSPDHQMTEDQPLKSLEAKYQVSLKSKFAHSLLGTPLSLWGGYTQSSRWQVYNGAASRPFRETNYEPELILLWPLDADVLGWRLRVASLSLNHQSNGRSLPLSRSWNRFIGTLALERGEWVTELRPWLRINESADDDDNPDINNYIGRGELRISRYAADHALSLQFRHTLRSGARSRGSDELDWVFPINGELHGYLQIFSGYGESLVDYNLRQTRVGLGVTIAGWR